MTDPQIHDLKTLFRYLGNAVMCIPEEYQVRVFKDMAYKLHEWNNVPISVLRDTLKEFDVDFNDTCAYCGEEMVDGKDDEEFCSYECRVASCGCKASPSCCGKDE